MSNDASTALRADPPAGRSDVRFVSGAETCAAWLYLPQDRPGPHPVVVLGHGLGATREMRLDAYAERFQQAGYAALVFDYRHFGASTGRPRQLLDILRQREDWHAAISYARRHPALDADRVVAWGSSFGGGHVIAVGAEDDRLAAVIAQCPFTDGLASSLAMDPRTVARLAPRAAADLLAAVRGDEPVYAPTAGPPHSGAFMTAPDAEPGYLALVPAETTMENRLAARFALQILRDRPGRRARDVTAPILFCITEPDSVAPAGRTRAYAEQAPRGEVVTHPGGHFGIYVGDGFEAVLADQLAFLARHVPVEPSGLD